MKRSTAEEFKTLGNQHYRSSRFSEAYAAYSKAITKNPDVATYYTNRALCLLQMHQYDKVSKDCRKAAELDGTSVKAFYYWGKASLSLGSFDEAIKLLSRAHELALTQEISFGDDITCQLRAARSEKFLLEEEKRRKSENELQTYLERLIDEDIARRVSELSNSVHAPTSEEESVKEEDNIVNETNREDSEMNSDGDVITVTDVISKLQLDAQTNKDMLNSLFAQVDEKRKRREIPDYLCGKISLGILNDPVITPYGITYDRSDILEHLRKVGHFDPVTRHELNESQLIPNLAMREVMEHFKMENPWAQFEDA